MSARYGVARSRQLIARINEIEAGSHRPELDRLEAMDVDRLCELYADREIEQPA